MLDNTNRHNCGAPAPYITRLPAIRGRYAVRVNGKRFLRVRQGCDSDRSDRPVHAGLEIPHGKYGVGCPRRYRGQRIDKRSDHIQIFYRGRAKERIQARQKQKKT